MAQDKESEQIKTLEMRIAALEDKLSKMNVTEEEMRAYEKVSALMGGAPQGAPGDITSDTGTVSACQVAVCQTTPTVCQIMRNRSIVPRSIIPRQIVRFCNECGPCGPCACDINQGGGGFSGGGGFGSFGA